MSRGERFLTVREGESPSGFMGLTRIQDGRLGIRREGHDLHRTAAYGAADAWQRRPLGSDRDQEGEDLVVVKRDQPPHRFHRHEAVGTQKAVVPHFLETLGQDVFEEPAEGSQASPALFSAPPGAT